MSGFIYGLPLIVDSRIPKDMIIVRGGKESTWAPTKEPAGVYIHPVRYLRLKYPHSPVWSERTLGHREMERDRRRHRLG